MAVFRVERTQGYTVMSNYHLRDKSLSLKAKGLLSQMLSLPEDWDYTLSGLAVINRENHRHRQPKGRCGQDHNLCQLRDWAGTGRKESASH